MTSKYRTRRPTVWVRLTENERNMAVRIAFRAARMVVARDAVKNRPRNLFDAIVTQTEAAGLEQNTQQYYLICRKALETMLDYLKAGTVEAPCNAEA